MSLGAIVKIVGKYCHLMIHPNIVAWEVVHFCRYLFTSLCDDSFHYILTTVLKSSVQIQFFLFVFSFLRWSNHGL